MGELKLTNQVNNQSLIPSIDVIQLTLTEDDYRTGYRNVTHCQQQQSYSLGRSYPTYLWHYFLFITFNVFYPHPESQMWISTLNFQLTVQSLNYLLFKLIQSWRWNKIKGRNLFILTNWLVATKKYQVCHFFFPLQNVRLVKMMRYQFLGKLIQVGYHLEEWTN